MKIVRNSLVDDANKVSTKCEDVATTTNESYSKYTENKFEKDGWNVTRSYSESRNLFDGQENFYASHNINREKDGYSEYVNRSYSVNNGMVNVSYSRGSNKTYKQCDMTYEDWKFDIEFQDDD